MKSFYVLLVVFVMIQVSIAYERDPVCNLKQETGRCRGYFPMFAFDCSLNKCVGFIYGGCGGNGNRFDTMEDCETACPPCPSHVE